MPPAPKHTRRWLQYSVGTMLVVIAAVAVWLSWELKFMPSTGWAMLQLAFILAGATAFATIPLRTRRSLFRHRDECEFSAWYDRYYAGSGISSEVAFAVANALAIEIGCSPTQLLPIDEIGGNLSHAMSGDDPFELADIVLEDSLRKMGVQWPLDNEVDPKRWTEIGVE